MKNTFRLLVGLSMLFNLKSIGQAYMPVNPHRVLVGAFPFQNFTYDARSAALGEAGVAISPDANSALMNPAKLVFLNASKDSIKEEKPYGISLHHTPYYRKLIRGMNLYALNTFKVKNAHAFGMTAKYFDAGSVEIRNEKGIFQRNFASKEFSIAGFYTKRLKHNNSFSVGLKYIHSDLSSTLKPANVVSGDLYFYHNSLLTPDGGIKKRWLNYGASLTNIGGKVSYGDFKLRTFQPTLLKLGAAQNFVLGKKQNILLFTIDANKLLVPTPSVRNAKNEVIAGRNEENISGIGTIFKSWGTAPDGFRETLREFTFSLGAEFQFRAGGVPHFYARAGYYTQNKRKGDLHSGGVPHFTLGLGGKFKDFGLDFSYLIPSKRNNVMSNTFRVSLNYCAFK